MLDLIATRETGAMTIHLTGIGLTFNRHLGQLVITRERGFIPGCKSAPKDETLCESLGLVEYEPIGSVADRYCNAVRAYMTGNISESEMMRITWTPNAGRTGPKRSKGVHLGSFDVRYLEAEHEAASKMRGVQRLFLYRQSRR